MKIQSRYALSGIVLLAVVAFGSPLRAQTKSPSQILSRMDQRRDQVISKLSLSEKLKFRSAMGTIQNNPQFISADNAAKNAATPEAQIHARKALAKVRLDLLEEQDPSLKPIVEKIRADEASAL